MKARDIMTTPVVSVDPAASLSHAIGLMISNNVGGLPVVEDGDRVCGMVTESDLLTGSEIASTAGHGHAVREKDNLRHDIRANDYSVGDVMTCDVTTATPEISVAGIAELMFVRKIRYVPIVKAGRLVGIVSLRDVLRTVREATEDTTAEGDDAIQISSQIGEMNLATTGH